MHSERIVNKADMRHICNENLWLPEAIVQALMTMLSDRQFAWFSEWGKTRK